MVRKNERQKKGSWEEGRERGTGKGWEREGREVERGMEGHRERECKMF